MSADNYRDCPKCKSKGTLREDYEIYSEDDSVYYEYSCGCSDDDCNYQFKFNGSRNFEGVN